MSVSSPDLEARVAALEQELAELRGAAASSLQPNLVTYDPATNTIGAQFTGLVNALGLIIPESAGTLAEDNMIVWPAPGQSTPVSTLGNPAPVMIGAQKDTWTDPNGVQQPADYFMEWVQQFGVNVAAVKQLLVGGSGITGITVEDQGVQPTGVSSRVNRITIGAEGPGVDTRVLLDGDGASNFAQLLDLHKLTIDDNDGAFYTVNINANANAFGSATFTTRKTSWTNAIPLGMLNNTGSSSTPATVLFQFVGPNSWTIQVANNGTSAGTYQWKGIVLGN